MLIIHDEVADVKIKLFDPMLPDCIAEKVKIIKQYTEKIERLARAGKFETIPYYEELIKRHQDFISKA